MARHSIFHVRNDDTEIEVEFTLTGGYPATGPSFNDSGDPGAPPELELLAAYDSITGARVELDANDEAAIQRDIWDHIGDYE